MIVTADQAKSIEAGKPFVVDGDKYIHPIPGGWMHDRRPPKVWADLDRPCERCDGLGVDFDQDELRYDCPDCHGTGRHVVELVTTLGEITRQQHSLGLFTIDIILSRFEGTQDEYNIVATKVDE